MSLYSDRYVLFRKLADGPHFVSLFDEADKARKRMNELACRDNADYFIQDIVQKKRIAAIERFRAKTS